MQVQGLLFLYLYRRPRGKAVQAIQALNPYNSSWRIKASVQNKGQLRSFTRNGSACSVFSVELVDDQVCMAVQR